MKRITSLMIAVAFTLLLTTSIMVCAEFFSLQDSISDDTIEKVKEFSPIVETFSQKTQSQLTYVSSETNVIKETFSVYRDESSFEYLFDANGKLDTVRDGDPLGAMSDYFIAIENNEAEPISADVAKQLAVKIAPQIFGDEVKEYDEIEAEIVGDNIYVTMSKTYGEYGLVKITVCEVALNGDGSLSSATIYRDGISRLADFDEQLLCGISEDVVRDYVEDAVTGRFGSFDSIEIIALSVVKDADDKYCLRIVSTVEATLDTSPTGDGVNHTYDMAFIPGEAYSFEFNLSYPLEG